MAPSLDRILRPLAEAGLELDAEAARDAVWLALRIARFEEHDTRGAAPVDTAAAADAAVAQPRDVSPPPSDSAAAPSRDAAAEPAPAEGMRAGVASAGTPLHGIRLPVAAALPEARGIARGMRPLRRRVPSAAGVDLDVDATVRRAAEEDIWHPVLRARRERWLDLALVVDVSRSMVVWRDVVGELNRVLRWSGAFRNITMWRAHAAETPVLYAGRADRSGGDRARPPSSLMTLPRRSLVLVVTDCVADAWYDGSFIAMLARWSRTSPVALVQVLPPRLWGRTALACGMPVQLHAPSIAATNAHLIGAATAAWMGDDDGEGGEGGGAFVAPIATLDPAALGQLARLIGGPATEATPGFAFDIAAMREAGAPPPPRAMPPTERVRRFWSVASSPARRLASAFAASPFLDLRVLRLLRRELIPGGSHLHEAEVVLGGILRRDERGENGGAETTFAFNEGVRALLLDNVATDDALRVLRRAAELAAAEQPDARLFLAALDDPAAVATPLERAAGSFADSIAGFLEWLGGPYARIVAEAPVTAIHEAPTEQAYVAEDEPEREPMQAPAPESGASPPWFFVSYAGPDYDPHLARFVDELRDAVRVKLGGSASEVAFMDRTDLRPSDDWSASVREALQASRVLIAILSPSYLKSDHAGREWSLFGMRQDAWAVSHDGTRPPVIVPVLWAALDDLPRPLPPAVGDIQLADASLPPAYTSRGARYLMATESRGHEELIQSLAERVVEAGSKFDLPRAEVPPDASIPNAFEHTARAPEEQARHADPEVVFHEFLLELDHMEPDRALAAAEVAAHEADGERRFDRSAMLLARRAVWLFRLDRREESENDLAGAAARARDVTDVTRRAAGLFAVGRAASEIGDLWQAKELLEDALQTQERLSEWAGAAETLDLLARIEVRRDEHRSAVDRLSRAASLRERVGDAAARATTLVERARIALAGDAESVAALPSLLADAVEGLRAAGVDADGEPLERVLDVLQRRDPAAYVPSVALFGDHRDKSWGDRFERALGVYAGIGAIHVGNFVGLGSDGSTWRPGSSESLEAADLVALLVSQSLLADERTVERVEQLAADRPGRMVPLFVEHVDRAALPWLREVDVQESTSRPLSDQPPEAQVQIVADMAGRMVELALESYADRSGRATGAETPLVHVDIDFDAPVGRDVVSENDLYALDRALKTRQRPLVVVSGPPRAGKTTLLQAWLASLRQADYRGTQILFGWSFYTEADVDDPDAGFDRFLVRALDWLSVDAGGRTPVDRALRLCSELAKKRSLLLLDGIETLGRPAGPDKMRSRGSARAVDSPLALPEAFVALFDMLLDRSGFLAVVTTTIWTDSVTVGYRTPATTTTPHVLHFPPGKVLRIDLPDRAAPA